MRIISFFAFGAACALAGCASGPPAATVAATSSDRGVDVQKVASIDRMARGRGVEVHWVNFPQRRPEAMSTTSAPVAPDLPTGT